MPFFQLLLRTSNTCQGQRLGADNRNLTAPPVDDLGCLGSTPRKVEGAIPVVCARWKG